MAVALLAALLLAACGGSNASSTSAPGPDPATAAPAGSIFYGEATIRPQGSQSGAIDGVLTKLLGTTDIGGAVTRELDKALASVQPGLSYESDISPWLGDRAAIFFDKLASGSNSSGAVVVSTTDPGAAGAAATKIAQDAPHSEPVHQATYKGVSYSTQGSGAFGVVGEFLVAGTEDGFKAAVNAFKGDSLAEAESYKSALSSAPDDRLATAFIDPKALLDAVAKYGTVGANGLDFLHLVQKASLEPIVAWADATPSSIGLELSTAAPKDAAAGSQSLISGFPADSWLAFGVHGVGPGLANGLDSLASLAPGTFGSSNPAAALDRIRRLTGLDLPSFAKWLDDVSGYVSGSSVFSLGGAVVLSSRNDSAAAKTLDEIQRILRNDVDLKVSTLGAGSSGFKVQPSSAPIEIDVEQRGGKVVAGLGVGAADRALSPDTTLGDSPAFQSATDALGSGLAPSFYLDFAPIGGFLSLSGASANPQIEQAKPYVDRLDYVVAGSGVVDGRMLSRLVLGVKDGSGSTSDVTAALTAP